MSYNIYDDSSYGSVQKHKIEECEFSAEEQEAGEGKWSKDNDDTKTTLSSSSDDIDGKPLEDEIDPLDAFMNDLDDQITEELSKDRRLETRCERLDDGEDMIESFVHFRAKQQLEAAEQKKSQGFSTQLEYDSDDNPIVTKRIIELLPPLDHSQIEYAPFEKRFYSEHSTITALSEEEVGRRLSDRKIKLCGANIVRLVDSFDKLGLDDGLMDVIRELNYTEPTSIQMQAIPVALDGRDLVGIAQTGSGKTVAFILPLITHIIKQKGSECRKEGPVGVIMAPTRELAEQIYHEVRRFSRPYHLRVAPIMGIMSRNELRKALKTHLHEIVVATPGMLIDMVKSRLVQMRSVTFLVLDEADKMFDMGFEPQIRSIVSQIRPDRQALLFSATFKQSVEQLVEDILMDPVQVNIGDVGSANEDINQIVQVLSSEEEKWIWLSRRLHEFALDGLVIIFVGSKKKVEEITNKIRCELNLPAVSLYGDKSYDEREKSMIAFKNGVVKIMVATDIAARGLDIRSVRTVVNYTNTGDIDAHIHRIGRTGRAGDKLGIAYTLLMPFEVNFAYSLLKNFELSNQEIPPELVKLAKRSSRWKRGKRNVRGKRGIHLASFHDANIGGPSEDFVNNSSFQPDNGNRGEPSDGTSTKNSVHRSRPKRLPPSSYLEFVPAKEAHSLSPKKSTDHPADEKLAIVDGDAPYDPLA